ncbi:hypothetical protein CRUP_020410, partial [Coryphaenoides rupestris]
TWMSVPLRRAVVGRWGTPASIPPAASGVSVAGGSEHNLQPALMWTSAQRSRRCAEARVCAPTHSAVTRVPARRVTGVTAHTAKMRTSVLQG